MKYVVLALALLVLIVIAQNTSVVMLRFLFWNVELSLVLVLLFTLLIGVAVGWTASWLRVRKRAGRVSVKGR